MPWDPVTTAANGAPAGFTNVDAANCVKAANFANSVYVNTSATTGATRQAFTYVPFGGMTLCVVGHIHIDPTTGAFTGAGNCYIPGWLNWDMATPAVQCAAIAAMPDGGAFPGANRYPH
ncbi:hypothetical protein [Nocardioides speluncae]|uniref:hypothetical protein n=1 Tax=Nocardioides speluncae TaxID=2670337 RepID=UPI000D692839|nr:hypothetical protein [Nocardioides speluncae]